MIDFDALPINSTVVTATSFKEELVIRRRFSHGYMLTLFDRDGTQLVELYIELHDMRTVNNLRERASEVLSLLRNIYEYGDDTCNIIDRMVDALNS